MTEYTARSLPHRPPCGLDCFVTLLRQKIDKSADGIALSRIHFRRSQALSLAELRQRLLNLADIGQRCRQTALYVREIGINGVSLSVLLDSRFRRSAHRKCPTQCKMPKHHVHRKAQLFALPQRPAEWYSVAVSDRRALHVLGTRQRREELLKRAIELEPHCARAHSAHGYPRRIDARAQHRLRHDATAPNGLEN